MQCIRTNVGILTATYFLLSSSCPCQTSAGWESTALFPLAKLQLDQTITSLQIDTDFPYFTF